MPDEKHIEDSETTKVVSYVLRQMENLRLHKNICPECFYSTVVMSLIGSLISSCADEDQDSMDGFKDLIDDMFDHPEKMISTYFSLDDADMGNPQ